jgi:hypothetical protein
LEIGPSFCLPPVESCRGTSPIQAAKIASGPKNPRIHDGRRYRARTDDADARNGLNPLALFVSAMLRLDPLLDRSDQRLQRLELRR